MIELVITKANGDVYWRERFPSLAHAQKWVQLEQAKPYWDNTYVVTYNNKTSSNETKEAAAAVIKAAEVQALNDAAAKLEGIGGLTLADINALFGTRLS